MRTRGWWLQQVLLFLIIWAFGPLLIVLAAGPRATAAGGIICFAIAIAVFAVCYRRSTPTSS